MMIKLLLRHVRNISTAVFISCSIYIYLLLYIAFNSKGHIAMGSLQVEETSAYCTVNHRASASNYQHSNMKRLAQTGGLRG